MTTTKPDPYRRARSISRELWFALGKRVDLNTDYDMYGAEAQISLLVPGSWFLALDYDNARAVQRVLDNTYIELRKALELDNDNNDNDSKSEEDGKQNRV